MDVLGYSVGLRRSGLYSVYGRLLRADLIKLWKKFYGSVDRELVGIFERYSHPITCGHNHAILSKFSTKTYVKHFICLPIINKNNNYKWSSISPYLQSKKRISSSMVQFKTTFSCIKQ